MLMTPLGGIRLKFDNNDIEYNIVKKEINHILYPDVNEVFRIKYQYTNDNMNHILKCYLDNDKMASYVEDGENYVSIGINSGSIKMNIGIEGDFGCPYVLYDYSGSYTNSGIVIEISPNTKSQTFVFGVSWLNFSDTEKEIQTWFASDLTLL